MPGVILIFGLVALAALAIYNQISANGGASLTTIIGNLTVSEPTFDGSNDPIAIALPLIKQFESFSPNAYSDPPGSGKYSIGYGHSIRPGDPYNAQSTIGESEASDLLRVDVGAAWTCVFQNVKIDCTPQQFAALISFVYNEGCAAFKSSTLLFDLNSGDSVSAAAEFAVWNKEHVNGVLTESAALTDRRRQEAQLFQSGVAA